MKKALLLTLLMSLAFASCTDDKESNSSSKSDVTSDVFQSSFSDIQNESADSDLSQSIGDAYTTSIYDDDSTQQSLISESNENIDESEEFDSSNEYSEDVYDDIEESQSSTVTSDSSDSEITSESSQISDSPSKSEAVSQNSSLPDEESESSQDTSSPNDGWTEFY